MSKIIDYIKSLTDELLVKLSNKGLLKRAYKDYQEKGIIPEISESSDRVEWFYSSSNVECSINSLNLTEARCSCNSSDICRHILTGVIHIKKTWNTEDKASEDEDPWEPLASVSDKEIIKETGKKAFEKAISSLQSGIIIELKKEDQLEAFFPHIGITCIFLPFAKAGSGICSCKKYYCEHQIMAILKMQEEAGKREISQEQKDRKISEEELKEIKSLIALLKELITTGLERVTDETVRRFETVALNLHNIPRLEKETRAISKLIESFIEKHAQFNLLKYLSSISRLYGLATILYLGIYPELEIRGEHKSKYINTGNINILCAGGKAWKSNSGYTGITMYCLDERKTGWFSVSVSRPDFYEGTNFNPLIAYNNETIWGNNIILKELMGKHVYLNNASRTMAGRLSSSKESNANIKDNISYEDLKSSDFYVEKWIDIINKIKKRNENLYLLEKETGNLFILSISHMEEPEFDKIKQELIQKVYDTEENIIYIKVPYVNENHIAIDNLEIIYKKKLMPLGILGHIYIENGNLCVAPISLYMENFILNLNIEKLNG